MGLAQTHPYDLEAAAFDRDTLNEALIDAHERQDVAALVQLYTMAGDAAEQQQDIDAACFYLTHAFVFALESGATEAIALNRRLAERGRAQMLEF